MELGGEKDMCQKDAGILNARGQRRDWPGSTFVESGHLS